MELSRSELASRFIWRSGEPFHHRLTFASYREGGHRDASKSFDTGL